MFEESSLSWSLDRSLLDSTIEQLLHTSRVCPSFWANRTQCTDLYQDVEGSMHLFIWTRLKGPQPLTNSHSANGLDINKAPQHVFMNGPDPVESFSAPLLLWDTMMPFKSTLAVHAGSSLHRILGQRRRAPRSACAMVLQTQANKADQGLYVQFEPETVA